MICERLLRNYGGKMQDNLLFHEYTPCNKYARTTPAIYYCIIAPLLCAEPAFSDNND